MRTVKEEIMQRLAIFGLVLVFAAAAFAGSDDAIESTQWRIRDALCDVLYFCSAAGFSNGVAYDHRSEIYAGGGMLYYVNFDDRWIHRVDPATCADVAMYPTPGGSSPSDIAVVDDEQAGSNAMLASTDFGTSMWYLQDLMTGALIASYPFPEGGNEGCAYDMQRNLVWIASAYSGMVYGYDVNGNLVQTINSPTGGGADGMAWKDDLLYAIDYSSDVWSYDFTTMIWTYVCNTGGVNGLSDDGNYLWGDYGNPSDLQQIDRECQIEVTIDGPTTAQAHEPYTYTVTLRNIGDTPVTTDVWTEAYYPDGSSWAQNPALHKTNLTLGPGVTITKTLTHVVPICAVGHFWYQINTGCLEPRDVDNFDGINIDVLP
jgi:hypothetical protein